MNDSNKIIIGSYPYRGNMHVCRLLCQYLGLNYQNQFFNPLSWKNYRQAQAKTWLFQQLPFLKDGQIVITQPMPMSNYIIKKTQRNQLLGANIDDMLIVDKFFWGKDLIQNFLSLIIENKNDPSRLVEQLKNNWQQMKKKLDQYQEQARSHQYYLGYISLIDFMLHEIFEYFRDVLKQQYSRFPKLWSIRRNFQNLPIISQYQKSNRTIKDMCPLDFYRKWKLQTMKTNTNQ